jgi:hypothetical protein
MKELMAFLLGIVIICAGWERPYREHYSFLAGSLGRAGIHVPPPGQAPLMAAPSSVPAPVVQTQTDKSWMWQKGNLDSNKQSGVDRAGVHAQEPMMRNQ